MRWVLPSERYFTERDVSKLQYVPILINEDGSYPVEANRYLVERSCGEWAPGADESNDPIVLTLESRKNMAARLCAFFFWCELDRRREWRTMRYEEDLLGLFQCGLLSGKSSASKRALKSGTINLYLDEACAFLRWASERGYREPFKVPMRRSRVPSSGGNHSLSHLGKRIDTRHGKLSVDEYDLDLLPSDREVARWMRSVQLRHPVKALIFELMVRTGARITEANQLRLSCFPRKSDWKPAWIANGKIPITLRFGVKGHKVQPASQLSTRSRIVHVPIDLAERIEHYVTFVRPNLLARYHRDKPPESLRTDRLWLGEHKCQPVTNQMLYKAWVSSLHCPEGWHPHAARHFFAVESLCNSTRELLKFHQIENPKGVSLGWLHGLMAGQIKLLLSPLLGHVSDNTTMRYLRCAQQRMTREFGHPALDWNSIIDMDLDDNNE